MRFIVSGGGTGGHVYPALAVVESLTRQCAEADIPLEMRWVGSTGGLEGDLVKRAGLTLDLIPAGGLRGKSPAAALKGALALGQGYRRSRGIVQEFQPDVLLVTGGYVCVPMTLAAWQAGRPVLIYLPDIEPGLAIKFLARFADRVAVTTDETVQFFRPGQAVVTGYPVRAALAEAAVENEAKKRAEARAVLGLSPQLPLLLVFGGSQGARSINRALTTEIESYLQICQVLHISGPRDADWVQTRRAALPADLQARYRVSAYLHEEMVTALLAADLVISRSGASVLGEFPVVGLPAVLVPYPHAGSHQKFNADYLARHRAAVVVLDSELDQRLKAVTLNLIKNPDRLSTMRQAGRRLAKPEAARHLAQEILGVGYYGN